MFNYKLSEAVFIISHSITAYHYIFGMYYDLNHVHPTEPFKSLLDKTGPCKGRLAFLTFINLVRI